MGVWKRRIREWNRERERRRERVLQLSCSQ